QTLTSPLGQDARVVETLGDIKNERLVQKEDFFGQCRTIDYSQFKIRGHYTHSPRLGRYFQTMIWLGRTDFSGAGGPFERCPDVKSYASPRELGGAILLWDLLNRSGMFPKWLMMDR